MMKNILILACLACSLQVFASDTTKVLFIGNSFTSANNMSDIFGNMAKEGGHETKIIEYAPGGVYVGDTRQGNMAHAYNPFVFDLIRSEKWDYIVIQDNQGAYCSYEGNLPAVANIIVGHTRLRDSAVANNPCAKIVLFAGWCFKNGWQQSPPIFNTGSEMNERVYVNYNVLNKSLNEIVSPIGIAWNRIIKDLPTTDLWSADEAHPSYAGSYLTAATLYSSIFVTNPERVKYDGLLDSARARHMRKVAYQTVVDSIAPTYLEKYTVSLTYTGAELQASTGYVKYEWYENDILIGTTTTPKFSIAVTKQGCYRVIATDASGCKLNSVEYCSTTTTGIEDHDYAQQVINVFPNPNKGAFNVTVKDPSRTVIVSLYGLTGSLVYSKVFEHANGNVYRNTLSGVADGIYILKVQTDKSIHTSRIQVSGN